MKKTLLILLVVPIVAACGGPAVLPPSTTEAAAIPSDIDGRYVKCDNDVSNTLLDIKATLGKLQESQQGGLESLQRNAPRLTEELRTTALNLQRRCQNLLPECLTVVDPIVDFVSKFADRFARIAAGDTATPFPDAPADRIARC